MLRYRAIRDIVEGEELFVTYKRPEPDGHGDEDMTLSKYLKVLSLICRETSIQR